MYSLGFENNQLLIEYFNFRETVAPSRKIGHPLDGKVSVQVTQDGTSNAYYITEADIHRCPFLKPVPQ